MAITSKRQKEIKEELDNKLAMSVPSRELLEELAITSAKCPSPSATFQYAFALSKSKEPSELRYAVSILDGLVTEGFEHQVDCMYGAAIALYRLGDYQAARERCEAILRTQPEMRVAKELHLASIEAEEQRRARKAKKVVFDGVLVAAAVGIVASAASVLLTKR